MPKGRVHYPNFETDLENISVSTRMPKEELDRMRAKLKDNKFNKTAFRVYNGHTTIASILRYAVEQFIAGKFY